MWGATTTTTTTATDDDDDRLPSSSSILQQILLPRRTSESSTGSSSRIVRLLSLGGGPGYDFVGAALVATFLGRLRVEATVFDYEEDWQELVETMTDVTLDGLLMTQKNKYGEHSCRWGGKCDITRPLLSHPSNTVLQRHLSSLSSSSSLHDNNNNNNNNVTRSSWCSDLVVCQYCIAENAVALRASQLVFFAELFRQAQPGTIFLFTETTPRVWPDFVDLLEQERIVGMVEEIEFPSCTGRGKSGPQLLLRKRGGADVGTAADFLSSSSTAGLLTPDQQLLCNGFRQMRVMHDLKMKSGWKRQYKMIPGEKKNALH